jgi:hypothetical protein
MSRLNSRCHTYSTYTDCVPFRSQRLSETLTPTWMTIRQSDEQPEPEDCEEIATESLDTDDLDSILSEGKEIVKQETAENIDNNAKEVKHRGLNAYGYVYHCGAQRLVISQPGERSTLRFGHFTCLKGIELTGDNTGVIVREAGDYEITFDLQIIAKASAPVTFELCTDDGALAGGSFVYILSGGITECRGSMMAALRSNDKVSVVMRSASVCEATLASAGLYIKKLD